MKRKIVVLLFAVFMLAVNVSQAYANFHNAFINIFEKVKDSVISITVRGDSVSPGAKPPVFEGAGFVWTSDGYIISTAHLFKGNIKEIETSIGQNMFKARLIGKDDKTDVALVKVDGAPPLKPLPFGDSDNIKIGEWVVAIGDPFGLNNTMTHGIISGKKRNIGMAPDEFIQHDTAINPGNSGGPLINMKSEVIGMNTAAAQGNNTGFAVPINLIKIIAPMLKINGKVTRSWIGIELTDSKSASDKIANEFNLPLFLLSDKNAVIITKVLAFSPADKAGIKKGDIIRFFNGKKIKNSLELVRLISYLPAEKTIYFVVERRNELLTLSLKPVTIEN